MGLFSKNAGLAQFAAITVLLNIRHIFYGLSLRDRYDRCRLSKLYLTHGLTDETYGLLTKVDAARDAESCIWITGRNHCYWVIGTVIGALAGSVISGKCVGLEFTLTCLFVVPAIEKAHSLRRASPFVSGAAAAALSSSAR